MICTSASNEKRLLRYAAVLGISLTLVACATHKPITPRPNGSYLVSTQGNYLINLEKARAQNIKEAEDFANEKKLELRILEDDLETDSGPNKQRGHKLVFRLVDAHHESLKRKSCFDDIQKNDNLRILTDKLSLIGTKEQTFSMYANKDLPNLQEKQAIALYGDLRKICYDIGEKAAKLSGVPEPILTLDYGSSSVGDELLVLLHNGEMSYGEFARLRKKIADIKQDGLTKIERELHRIGPGALLRAMDIAKSTITEMEKALEKKIELTHSDRVFKEIESGGADDEY